MLNREQTIRTYRSIVLTAAIPVVATETEADAESKDLVESILEQLAPLIARQRKALVQAGCFRQISSTHLHVLYMLVSRGAMPMSRLAEQLDVSLPNVTGIVERMVERGFVERLRPVDDRRVVEVRITAAGREILDEIDTIKRHEMATVIGRLTPAQQDRALRAFTDMRIATEQLALEESQTKLPTGDPA
jgi:DNA-binding MarR family transcriptional regulator